MHELGIAFHIVKEVEAFAEERKIKHIDGVTLELGEVSGVIPQYLMDVWDWACEHRSEHMKGCKLKIIELKAISYCQDCKETYNTIPSGKKCPKCGGNNTYLIEGNEAKIQSVQVQDEKEAAQ